jgi:hypothetical protein
MSTRSTTQLLDLPTDLLALVFQHVASGSKGLVHAADFNQTCKALHTLYKEPGRVTYRNLFLDANEGLDPYHPFWQWLDNNSGRVHGLTLDLHLGVLHDEATENAEQLQQDWTKPLQTLRAIPGVQLRIFCDDSIEDLTHPCIAQWLKQHGQLISHLTTAIDIHLERLNLAEFSESVSAPGRSLDLIIRHDPRQYPVVDLDELDAVAGSLHRFTCEGYHRQHSILRGASAFKSMSQLAALDLRHVDIISEDLWDPLAQLTSLQQLSLAVAASGDPSPLSALTRLSQLMLHSSLPAEPEELEAEGFEPSPAPFSFSSLQPLSTLQQLEVLHLEGYACHSAMSLQGLAGLSNLKRLSLCFPDSGSKLRSLAGISPAVVELSLSDAPVGLVGIEGCTRLENLVLDSCPGVFSLQPLRGLSSLKQLEVSGCPLTSLKSLHSTSLHSLTLKFCRSLTLLSGIEHLSALKSLEVVACDVTSLQPLSQLGEGLQKLSVSACYSVQEEVLELPRVSFTADVVVSKSNVLEVVLAEGMRRAAVPWHWYDDTLIPDFI